MIHIPTVFEAIISCALGGFSALGGSLLVIILDKQARAEFSASIAQNGTRKGILKVLGK